MQFKQVLGWYPEALSKWRMSHMEKWLNVQCHLIHYFSSLVSLALVRLTLNINKGEILDKVDF